MQFDAYATSGRASPQVPIPPYPSILGIRYIAALKDVPSVELHARLCPCTGIARRRPPARVHENPNRSPRRDLNQRYAMSKTALWAAVLHHIGVTNENDHARRAGTCRPYRRVGLNFRHEPISPLLKTHIHRIRVD